MARAEHAAEFDQRQLLNLMFSNGFSTASEETDIRENAVVPMSKPSNTKEVEQKEMKKSIGLYAKLVRILGGEM